MSFTNCGFLVQSPPLTLPHLNNIKVLFLRITSSQFTELSFLATALNIFVSERGSCFLTGKEMIKAAYCFKYSVAIRTKSKLKLKKSSFFCVVVVLNLPLWFLVLFVEIKAWTFFQSYGSCFVEVWINLSLNRDLNA